MCPATSGALSSISQTGSEVRSCRKVASRLSRSRLRCCTMTIGTSNESGRPATSVDSAFNPPHDVPTTTMSYILLHLAVDLVLRRERLVASVELREPEGLLRAKRENTEHDEAVVEQLVHPRLQRPVEVDEHVAADDDVELGERPIGDQVVLREDDVPLQRRREERPVVLRHIVLRERSLAACPDVVLRVLLHPVQRKDAALRALNDDLVDVGGVAPRPVVEALLLAEDRQRVHIRPRSDPAV